MENAIKVLEETDDIITIGGYGVIFGHKDLVGDTFTKSTDLMSNLVPEKLTYYDHNQGSIKGTLGKSVIQHVDSVGVWVESQLDRHNEYIDGVMKLVRAGVLGYSSGSVSHLVSRDGGNIKSWPIVEFSLTPTPAEPRTIGVEFIKSLVEQHPEFSELLPMEIEMEKEKEVAQKVEETAPVVDAVKAYDDSALTGKVDEMAAEIKRLKSIKINPVPMASTKGYSDALKADADFALWAKTGGATEHEIKAVNITTATEGQEIVPVGHYNQVIARMEELGPLYSRLGVRNIPGRGTTVNVPIDNAAGGVMALTTESAAAAEDDPTFSQVAMTLGTYRTQIRVTQEILNDEDSNLLAFLASRASRIMTNTHNSLLLAAVAAGGTNYHTFAGEAAFAAGEVEQMAGNDVLAPYVDDQSAAWVMRNSTFMDIQSITGDRFYRDDTAGGLVGTKNRMLLDYPVHRSNYAAAAAASAKPIYLGNWDYVGVRHAPTFTVLRDPYSRAANGEVVFHYFMRTVYKVLQAEAVGYGTMAAA